MTMVAVVTGASRGAGKGIAVALGRTGATVYVTGRSRTADDSPYGGTVDETAALVTEAGGLGVPMAVDHGDDEAVAELFATVGREQGKLDILVNNAAKVTIVRGPFWTEPPAVADLLTVGLRSHYIAAFHAAPLMIAGGRGLIVHTGHYGACPTTRVPPTGRRRREPTRWPPIWPGNCARTTSPPSRSGWAGWTPNACAPTRTPCRLRRVTCGASRPSSPDG
jgi:NAD(P)-dependent dehydrogenase (short-subunit alcohol dehydrogenase family)